MPIIRNFLDYLEYFLIRLLSLIVVNLPDKLVYRAGECIGILAFMVSKRSRNTIVNNLTYIYGDKWSEEKIISVAKQVSKNLGKTFIEFLQYPKYSPEDIKKKMKIVNSHYLDEALSGGKGVILLAPHLGNFELACARVSIDYPLEIVARPLRNKLLNEFVTKVKAQCGVKLIFTTEDDAKQQYIECLGQNKILTIAVDLDAGKRGIFIDFLGKPASTYCGWVVIAQRTGCAVITGFPIRHNSTHVAIFEKMVDLEFTEDKEKDLFVNTVKANKIVEDYINRYPEQWFWLNKRWRTKI